MLKLLVASSLSISLLIVGCSAKPQAGGRMGRAVSADSTKNPVIVHIVNQRQTITISSSPQGLLYSLKDSQGQMMIADATQKQFAELQPALYQNIKHYIAVHADVAPLPADAGMEPVPISIDNAAR